MIINYEYVVTFIDKASGNDGWVECAERDDAVRFVEKHKDSWEIFNIWKKFTN